jgi:hypothetical protein
MRKTTLNNSLCGDFLEATSGKDRLLKKTVEGLETVRH